MCKYRREEGMGANERETVSIINVGVSVFGQDSVWVWTDADA